jgi:hypothetical protein
MAGFMNAPSFLGFIPSFPCLRAVALQRAGVRTEIQTVNIKKYGFLLPQE